MTATNNNSLTIRHKTDADCSAAALLVAEAFREKYSAFANGNWKKAVLIAKDEMKWRGQSGNFFVAELEGVVSGAIEIIGTGLQSVPYGELVSIYLKHLGLVKGMRAAYLCSLLSRVVEEDEACISNLAVAPEVRGKGVARALIAHAERFAVDAEKNSMVLWVSEINIPAVRLYKSAGFNAEIANSSQQLNRFFGHEKWLQMRKTLKE